MDEIEPSQEIVKNKGWFLPIHVANVLKLSQLQFYGRFKISDLFYGENHFFIFIVSSTGESDQPCFYLNFVFAIINK